MSASDTPEKKRKQQDIAFFFQSSGRAKKVACDRHANASPPTAAARLPSVAPPVAVNSPASASAVVTSPPSAEKTAAALTSPSSAKKRAAARSRPSPLTSSASASAATPLPVASCAAQPATATATATPSTLPPPPPPSSSGTAAATTIATAAPAPTPRAPRSKEDKELPHIERGKVRFREPRLPLENMSTTLSLLVQFREFIDAPSVGPLDALPPQYHALLAHYVQDATASLDHVAQTVYNKMMPPRIDSGDDSLSESDDDADAVQDAGFSSDPSRDPRSKLAVDHIRKAIIAIADRVNYGGMRRTPPPPDVVAPSPGSTPALPSTTESAVLSTPVPSAEADLAIPSLALYRWEIKQPSLYFSPDVCRQIEQRVERRLAAKAHLASLVAEMPDAMYASLLAGGKVTQRNLVVAAAKPAKAAKLAKASSATDATAPSAAASSTVTASMIVPAPVATADMTDETLPAPVPPPKETAAQARARRTAEAEAAALAAQPRLSGFFSVRKPAHPAPAVAAAGGGRGAPGAAADGGAGGVPAAYRRLFLPYQLKSHATLAPRPAPMTPAAQAAFDALLADPAASAASLARDEAAARRANGRVGFFQRTARTAHRPRLAPNAADTTWKLIQFHLQWRPPYWGTWIRTADERDIRPRRPFARSRQLDYDVQSDLEWEEDVSGDDCSDAGEEDDEELAGGPGDSASEMLEDEDDGWLVPHGYLSDDEGMADGHGDGDEAMADAEAGGEGGPLSLSKLMKTAALPDATSGDPCQTAASRGMKRHQNDIVRRPVQICDQYVWGIQYEGDDAADRTHPSYNPLAVRIVACASFLVPNAPLVDAARPEDGAAIAEWDDALLSKDGMTIRFDAVHAAAKDGARDAKDAKGLEADDAKAAPKRGPFPQQRDPDLARLIDAQDTPHLPVLVEAARPHFPEVTKRHLEIAIKRIAVKGKRIRTAPGDVDPAAAALAPAVKPEFATDAASPTAPRTVDATPGLATTAPPPSTEDANRGHAWRVKRALLHLLPPPVAQARQRAFEASDAAQEASRLRKQQRQLDRELKSAAATAAAAAAAAALGRAATAPSAGARTATVAPGLMTPVTDTASSAAVFRRASPDGAARPVPLPAARPAAGAPNALMRSPPTPTPAKRVAGPADAPASPEPRGASPAQSEHASRHALRLFASPGGGPRPVTAPAAPASALANGGASGVGALPHASQASLASMFKKTATVPLARPSLAGSSRSAGAAAAAPARQQVALPLHSLRPVAVPPGMSAKAAGKRPLP
ncbi:hypothetical protein CXG81DRAFT_16445 [Caulochytrium protostelioides]|uniref:Chromatin assembly factor 1 subunit A dimerization domain-containing protein n=1 Tax=Caulochytrium protostelioides TaxID=1555241 RepID=A0A4P9XF15_9FUNG|nr:hypothetical protein CXG81DRAFT_16445 [Caulochytrium protostelioides]|eukprot:RKP04167.1 hypothetical protein CXG81DRAFT_16445 [Caulochytrium protostelioides]